MLYLTTNKKILIITGLIAILIFIAVKKLIYQPNTQQLNSVLKSLDEEYEKNRIAFEIAKFKDEIGAYAKETLKSEKDLPWLLGKISDIFNALHLELISVEPQPSEKTAFYTRIPVKVRTACSYHNVGELVSRFESLEKFVDVSLLELRSLGGVDSGEEGLGKKKSAQTIARVDKKGFILTEVTLKLSAFHLH